MRDSKVVRLLIPDILEQVRVEAWEPPVMNYIIKQKP